MKLDLILENTRNKYALGLLEESANLTEIDLLKGRMMINESTMSIRKMLVEEGTMESIKSFLEESWTNALLEEFSGIAGDLDIAGGNYLSGVDSDAGQAASTAFYHARNNDMGVDDVIPAAALVGAGVAGTAALGRYSDRNNPGQFRRDVAAVRAVPGQVVQAARQVPVDTRAGYTAGMNPNRFSRNNPGFAYNVGKSAAGFARPFRG